MNEDVTLRGLDGFGVLAHLCTCASTSWDRLGVEHDRSKLSLHVIFQVGCERYGKGPVRANQLTLVDVTVDFLCGC